MAMENTDKHAAEAQPFFDAIQASGLTSLSLSGTGMGPVSCSKLAGAVSAALTSLTIDRMHGGIFGEVMNMAA